MSEVYPTPNAVDGAALFEARESGRAAMVEVDEAEIRAVGFTPQPRGEGIPEFPQALAAFDDPVIRAAGDRLVSRGLATPEPTARSVVTPSGALLAWLVGVVTAGRASFNVAEVREPAGAVRAVRRRVTLATAQLGWPMAMVEHTEVPEGAGPEPLPVRIEAVRPDVLVDELVDAAYAVPPAPGSTLTLDLLSLTSHGPARLAVDAEHAVLLTHGHGLRKSSTRNRPADPDVFRSYVREMLEELVPGSGRKG
ncbi:MAG TPA: hypothetical protein VHO29_01255 [Marmoricola sp.]|nr:hypothetical protein [Marmoricola sp.]